METVVSIVFGGLITIFTAIGVEYLRRPRLWFSIETPHLDLPSPNEPGKMRRHLRVHLHNRPLPVAMRWMQRAAALYCRGEITFHHLDGQAVLDAPMPVRWVRSPEPVASQVFDPANIAQPKFFIVDFSKPAAQSRIDVYPGEQELLDIAVRFEGEPDCYGWNNESYVHNWRNPQWKLPHGRYLVKVAVSSSGEKCVGIFRLVNDVEQQDGFRLLPSTAEDRAKIR